MCEHIPKRLTATMRLHVYFYFICMWVVQLSTPLQYSQDECPPGKHTFTNCSDPCNGNGDTVYCESNHQAECRADFCGGCITRFYDDHDNEIQCKTEVGFVCEMRPLTIGCLDDSIKVIQMKWANYGRTSPYICLHPYGLDRLHNTTECRASNSLSIVYDLCQGKRECTLKVDNHLFENDPCPGIYKYLEFDFDCVKPDILNEAPARCSSSSYIALSHIVVAMLSYRVI